MTASRRSEEENPAPNSPHLEQVEFAEPASRSRGSSLSAEQRSAAEELSFKLFDGQSLQYTDKILDGFYDVWGGSLLGMGDNTPAAKFPSLQELSQLPYTEGSDTEILVVDRSRDNRLRELETRAADLMDQNRPATATKCVQELAILVANSMGGPASHEELSTKYKDLSQRLKSTQQSAILLLGDLTVGLSRHRALLLKVVADNCNLPCRLVRGDFYLGAAGHSGEDSVVLLHFDGQEWMVELITEPGRLYHVRSGKASGEEPTGRWQQPNRSIRSIDTARTSLPTHGYPTLPQRSGEHRESSSNSPPGGQREGLHWSELDGPTMNELGDSGSSHTSTSSLGLTAPHQLLLAPDDSLAAGLSRRLSTDKGMEPRFPAGFGKDEQGKQGDVSVLQSGAQGSVPVSEASDEGAPSVGSQEGGWMDYNKDAFPSQGAQLGPLEEVQEVRPSRFASTVGQGPARARVRGRDARGRLIELELQGLTVTHAHNLALGNRSLDTIQPGNQKPSEDEHQSSRSLESLIGQYRYLNTGTSLDPRWRQASGSPSASRGSSGSQAEEPKDRNMRSFLRDKVPGLSEGERQRGEAWEKEMRIRYSSDSMPRSSGSGRPSGEHTSGASWSNRGSETAMIDPETARSHVHNLLHNPQVARQLSGEQQPDYTSGDKQASGLRPGALSNYGLGSDSPASFTSAANSSLSELTSSTDEAEVDFSEVELGPRIGVGCFGEVFKARWRQTTVAVKRLFAQSLSENSIKEFKAEVLMNRRLKHPNVILFMGACTRPPNLSIVTQWAPRGSLFQLLHSSKQRRPQLTLRQKLRMALDIARGMHYLHSAKPPIIHRDLKSMNLLVDNDLTIKVCDFGLARIRSSTWMTGSSQGGTPEWTAPEVLRSAQYNEKSDVYSYGVVMYELATGREPWDEMTPMQVVGAVGWAGNRLEPPADCPKIFADLMLSCFQAAEERPSFDEIIQILLRFANETRPGSASE